MTLPAHAYPSSYQCAAGLQSSAKLLIRPPIWKQASDALLSFARRVHCW